MLFSTQNFMTHSLFYIPVCSISFTQPGKKLFDIFCLRLFVCLLVRTGRLENCRKEIIQETFFTAFSLPLSAFFFSAITVELHSRIKSNNVQTAQTACCLRFKEQSSEKREREEQEELLNLIKKMLATAAAKRF